MIWIVIVAAFRGLFGTALMCMLIVAGRADDLMESRTIDGFASGQRVETPAPAAHLPVVPDRVQGWAIAQPQQNPL